MILSGFGLTANSVGLVGRATEFRGLPYLHQDLGMEQMGDNVSGRKLVKLGFASLALALAVTSGAVVMEGRADAATKAKPKPKAAAASPGRKLFVDWSCGSCHTLKDAGGSGHVGPELDGAKLSKAFVAGRITNGQGSMPSFGGSLTRQGNRRAGDLHLGPVEQVSD